MDSTQPITIVHTRSGMCLTTVRFGDWTDVQTAFADYMTSLGPFGEHETLQYLSIEYPGGAPFSHSEVRRIARRPGAYSWAPSEPPSTGNGLRLGTTDGDSFRLAIAGYQFPDAEDLEQRFSWYMVEGAASQADRSWDFQWQALTCDTPPLICAWLFDLASWVQSGSDNDPPAPPYLVEPNVQFPAVSWENGRAVLTVALNAEFRHPEARQGRVRSRRPDMLHIRATAEELRRAAIDFAATIARYPEAAASRPVSSPHQS